MPTPPKVYLVRAGKHGEDEELALDQGLAIIGFRDFPPLTEITSVEALVSVMQDRLPEAKRQRIINLAGQFWTFAQRIQVGDLIVLPRKAISQIAIGRVTGPYQCRQIGQEQRHTRPVQWLRTDLPRTAFLQDLLHSLGAALTVCAITRNQAERRVAAVLDGQPDPGQSVLPATSRRAAQPPGESLPESEAPAALLDLDQAANDQIIAHIQTRFAGHALAELVAAVLSADGWVTKLSPPGADGGVDILAGRGSLGLDAPRLCVQVKSQTSSVDVTVFRTLQGAMRSFNADQGLLVAWGGCNRAVRAEARQSHFIVRLWDSSDLVEAIYRNYERLPPEIQAELPLKRVWMLVTEDADA